MSNINHKGLKGLFIVLTLVLTAVPAFSVEYWLRADVTYKVMPDGEIIYMWGFAKDSSWTVEDGEVMIPGPALEVPPGDTTLTIHLKNRLTAANTGRAMGTPISLIIHGQIADMSPTFWGSSPYPEYQGRMRSLTHETQPGNMMAMNYTWTNMKPGTFIYQSGTHMALQVAMGLYGPAIVRPAAGEVYPGVSFDNEVTLFYSEIDPALHRAVEMDQYGPNKMMTSTIYYAARYFLINGMPFSSPPAGIATVNTGDRVLIRFLSTAYEQHVPTFVNYYVDVIAEDGNPYPFVKRQYGVQLPPAKTLDVILEPDTPGLLPIFDAALSLTNDGSTPGGMLTYLDVNSLRRKPTQPRRVPPKDAPLGIRGNK